MAKKEEESFYIKYNMKWVLFITFWTFVLAIGISVVAENLVQNLDVLFAFIILLIIIFIGILFDVIGIAVTAASEKPFHAMAANKIDEARIAIKLVRNSSQVSNFCNDVIGDISGIISGAVATSIVFRLILIVGIADGTILTILLTAFTASLTVGGKGVGKSIAEYHHEQIIFQVAKVVNFAEKLLNVELFATKRKAKDRKVKEK
jgi:Mg2+/Co2+ transporter CorB